MTVLLGFYLPQIVVTKASLFRESGGGQALFSTVLFDVFSDSIIENLTVEITLSHIKSPRKLYMGWHENVCELMADKFFLQVGRRCGTV